MLLKPLFRLPQKTNFHFVKYFKVCFALSIIGIVGTVVLLFIQGLNFGIDFKGGTLMQVQTPTAAEAAKLRTTLTEIGVGEIQIQNFGKDDELLIRFPEQEGGPEAQKVAADKVLAALPQGTKELRREQVGSTVSKELINSAIWALVLANLGIFAYVWFRFEWQFALGAIIALIHDVMITIGLWSLFGLDFDLTIVAALLTILGYSINDTVVIYDRIRENLRRYKKMPLPQLLDLSVNETMSRTIMTVATVLMALIPLYIFGGEVIRGFTFAMIFGTLIGTYSSVYIAAPFLILIGVKRDWSGVEKAGAKPGVPGAKPAKSASSRPENRPAIETSEADAFEPTDTPEVETPAPARVATKPSGYRPPAGRKAGRGKRR
ncbi:preprotein translocase subunit SecF [Rhodomicrobium udaipurense JA643]|uniref:Protein-export membrane protein SecF n=1 Tax=Rhodomicrobium udaipurense TaxID=1202716 RepID=A0A8I1GCM8_9HYPH|nr:protein translocase subunit SecF [Rhodomicrobium udaipurense]KAI96303.1 preprotein translocase subunit SecF [Rhodomicrobium udaipurense JA643]MBJ7542444.1 protein translocase subunit SecF [Rhodomicrobium udaipurense]